MGKRESVVEEFVMTERTFVAHLTALETYFHQPLLASCSEKKPITTLETVKCIFSCLTSILDCSRTLSRRLDERWSSWNPQQSTIGDIVLEFVEFLKMYIPYVENYNTSVQITSQLLSQSSDFAKFVKSAEKHKECKCLKLDSLLIMPVQRIPRYRLLLQELLGCTPRDHGDYPLVEQALDKVKVVAEKINERVAHAEALGKVVSIQSSVHHLPECIVSPSRLLVRTAEASEISGNGDQTHVTVYLFNDLVLIAQHKASGGLFSSSSGSKLVWKSQLLLQNLMSASVNANGCVVLETEKMKIAFRIETKTESAEDWISDIRNHAEACVENLRIVNDGRHRVSSSRAESMRALIEQQYAGQRPQTFAFNRRLSSSFSADAVLVPRVPSSSSNDEDNNNNSSSGSGSVIRSSSDRNVLNVSSSSSSAAKAAVVKEAIEQHYTNHAFAIEKQ